MLNIDEVCERYRSGTAKRPKPSSIFIDMDGVLADCQAGLSTLHGFDDPYLREESLGEWELSRLLDMTPAEIWEPCGREFWASLPTIDGYLELLHACELMVGQESVCLLTSPTLSPECSAGKVEWIYRHLPNYRRQFLIGPQKHHCAKFGSLLIDDADHNVDKFRDHGGDAILVPQPWNSAYSMRDQRKQLVHAELKRREIE